MPPRKLRSDWMITPAYGPGLQSERIAINQGALCIECKACGRRSALTTEAQERGNLTRAPTRQLR